MKRLVILIIVMLISANTVMAHQPQRSRSRTMGGRQDYSRARYSRSYSNGTYRAYPYVQRGYSGYGNYRRTYSNYGGSYYGSRPSTNINVRYNERWDSMGGERSYEQSPDLLGKIIDGGIILGALSIIR